MEHFGSIRKKARQRRSLDLPASQRKAPSKVSSHDDLGGVYMQINMEDLGLFGQVDKIPQNLGSAKRTNSSHGHHDKPFDSSGERKSSDDPNKPSNHSRPPKSRRTREGHKKIRSGRRSEMVADLRAFQGQGHGQDIKQLADLFYDSKTNMLGMVEDELKLKLELKNIKEQFLHLLQHFEAFEERHQQLENYMVSQVPTRWSDVRHRSSKYDSGHIPYGHDGIYSSAAAMTHHQRSGTPRKRTYTNPTSAQKPQSSRKTRHRHAEKFQSYVPEVPVPCTENKSGSVELSMNDYSWSLNKQDPLAASGPTRPDESDIKDLTQISEITKYSTTSDLHGPLQSTLNYPQHSTPEKLRQLLEASISLLPDLASLNPGLDGVSCVQHLDLTTASSSERPVPTGEDSIQSSAANSTKPIRAAIPWNKVLSDHFDSSGEKTPVNSCTAKSRLLNDGQASDSGINTNEGSATMVTASTSRELFLGQVETGSETSSMMSQQASSVQSEGSSSCSRKMRRQSALQDICSPQYEEPGLSETDLKANDSYPALQQQFSIEATRHSMADASALTSTSELGPPLSDTTTSDRHFSMTSGTASSYKESDAHPSPEKSLDDIEFGFLPGHVSAAEFRSTDGSAYQAPQNSMTHNPSASTMECSLARTDSLYGAQAPMNSPNNTDFSLSSRPTLDSVDTADSADLYTPAKVTGRPPVIGGESCAMGARSKHSSQSSSGSGSSKERNHKSTSSQPSGFSVKVHSTTKVMIQREVNMQFTRNSSGSCDSLSSSYDQMNFRTPTNKARQHHSYETDKTPTNKPQTLCLDQRSYDSSDKDKTPKAVMDTPTKLKARGSNVRRSFSKKIKNFGRQIKGHFKSKHETPL